MIVLNENIKGLKVGTKMIGNWGAMIPLSYGTVTDVIRDYKGVDVEVTIEWDDLKEATYWTKDINKGPGIGIYTEDALVYKGELIIMKFIELKVTYEWFTPKGKRRTFYDFAFGISQMECIDNIKKHIKRRIRHENYVKNGV